MKIIINKALVSHNVSTAPQFFYQKVESSIFGAAVIPEAIKQLHNSECKRNETCVGRCGNFALIQAKMYGSVLGLNWKRSRPISPQALRPRKMLLC
jgi:hypothetical protein